MYTQQVQYIFIIIIINSLILNLCIYVLEMCNSMMICITMKKDGTCKIPNVNY